MDINNRKDISIVLSGEAGQGLQTMERLMLRIFKLSGYHVFSYDEVMSRIRGGNNSTEIRVSSERINSFVGRIDFFVSLHVDAMERFHERISDDTIIIGEAANIEGRYRNGKNTVIEVPIGEMARQAGGPIYANIIVIGIFTALFGVEQEFVRGQLKNSFKKLSDDAMAKNFAAAEKGFEAGKEISRRHGIVIGLARTDGVKGELLLSGADAVGIGGLAGGCNFVSSYPMSPSTEVLTFFAGVSEEFGIVVEQAEDEISAVNMVLGSWYAGGRGMVTTSGGGFALMVEALSLAGAVESPLVVHLGQRPGPATGLPTRTEQGDLMFSLFAGHGEFPRAIFAPGDFEQGFALTRRAFYIADTYQVPAIILTDQYFLDSYYNVPDLDIRSGMAENHIVPTDEGYRRYRITETGVSPRGIPGLGSGIVCLDSDEHTEEGYITEDFGVRTAMVDKRLRKLRAMEKEILPPRLYGPDKYTYLLVAWGSTLNAVREALRNAGRNDTALLHFEQVYPLHADTARLLARAKKKVIIENNATSQFGGLIKLITGAVFDRAILKYDGMPFTVEEITAAIRELP